MQKNTITKNSNYRGSKNAKTTPIQRIVIIEGPENVKRLARTNPTECEALFVLRRRAENGVRTELCFQKDASQQSSNQHSSM